MTDLSTANSAVVQTPPACACHFCAKPIEGPAWYYKNRFSGPWPYHPNSRCSQMAGALGHRRCKRPADAPGATNLSASDREAISAMPNDWFDPVRLPFPKVRRPEYRCSRLTELGILESRVTGTFPSLKTEYRLRNSAG